MKYGRLLKGEETVVSNLEIATGSLERAAGLLGRGALPAGSGLYLDPAAVIHTFFMRFELDLIFLERGGVVTDIRRWVGPFRVIRGQGDSTAVVEVASGWLQEQRLDVGDRLNISLCLPE
jgi:hypothetical protein